MKSNVIMTVVTCLFLSMGALHARGDASAERLKKEGWTLQFSDDFSREQLGDDWLVLSGQWNISFGDEFAIANGNWSIEDGMLAGGKSGQLLCLWKFTGDQRLEYDAVAEDDACDLSAFLGGSKIGFQKGYLFGFGSDLNAFSKLLINSQRVKRYEAKIVPGKLHHIVCQREGGRLTHMVDGTVVMTFDHDKPLTGRGHEMMGFYIYTKGNIDNVKIYTKRGSASKVPARNPAAVAAVSRRQITGKVTLINSDKTPATNPGPGDISQGTIGFDFYHRSLFVDLIIPQTVDRIVLKSDPKSKAKGASVSKNLTSRTLELYTSVDNVKFRKVTFTLHKPRNGTVVLEGFQVKTKYLKIHYVPNTDKYRFVNHLKDMVRIFGPAEIKLANIVPDPVFEELFGDVPGPKRFFSYATKYDARVKGHGATAQRATAKRFGMRYVLDEMLEEAARYNLVVYGTMSEPAYKKYGLATRSRPVEPTNRQALVSLPDGTLPIVTAGQGWIMDPRYLDYYVSEMAQRAREKEQWAIPYNDEIWTYYVIKPVAKDKWYKQVIEADLEIKEKYGFGKYTMPESHEDGDPFDRIAFGRWASDKLTEMFKKSYQAAKSINPDMKIIGPTHGSSATSGDMEAWSPYFDIYGGQCGSGRSPSLIDKFRVGGVTKLYVDLIDTPVWMMVHTSVRHAPLREPEDIREMFSQVFRNGGQGLWLMSREWFEVELNESMFAEPAKSRAQFQLSESISKMRLPKLPQADCAILYSSDSTLTNKWGGLTGNNDRIISAYTVLGPVLRSGFHFVSDRQIDRGTRDLQDYKVLYVPYAPYQRASVLDKIKAYVKSGGIVVCTDTDAFTWNINGESLAGEWEELSGVRKTGDRQGDAIMQTVATNPLALPKPLSLAALVPGSQVVAVEDDVVNVAVFKDGSPAITLRPYGKGKVIFFAADPFFATGIDKSKESVVAMQSPIVEFVKAIQKSAGAQMGHDIWRFKLPPYTSDVYLKETDLCLTDNYVYDINEPLLEPNNLQTGGTYSYSRLPTGIADYGQPGKPVSFKKGKLTNRLKAYETRQKFGSRNKNYDKITPNWIVSWTDSAPVSITFDLKSDYPLSKLHLFYSGTMPALQVSSSSNAKQWEQLSLTSEQSAGLDVKDVVVPLGRKCRYVKLEFMAREVGDKFELSEVELWSEPGQ